MCPICREPVTLGGGITMENTGPGALASARNSCSFTQNSAQRGSICCGSYALAISRAIRPDTPGKFLRCRTCERRTELADQSLTIRGESRHGQLNENGA